jgi:hypothetical protein
MSTLTTNIRPHAVSRRTPPLENGDRLTRAEFERRYHATTGVKKAELINGVVYMASPVRLAQHGRPHSLLNAWLTTYATSTPGIDAFGDNATVRIDEDNQAQPDLQMSRPPHAGGRSKIDDEGYVVGPPDLVCEVAASTVALDLHLKADLYRRCGVREYLVWRVDDGAIDWFANREGRFEQLARVDEIIKSEVFPGLWLDARALPAGDMPRVITILQQGLVDATHKAFVSTLRG